MPGSDALPSPSYFIWRRILSHTFSAFQRGKGSSTGNSALGLTSEHGTTRRASRSRRRDVRCIAGGAARSTARLHQMENILQDLARFRLHPDLSTRPIFEANTHLSAFFALLGCTRADKTRLYPIISCVCAGLACRTRGLPGRPEPARVVRAARSKQLRVQHIVRPCFLYFDEIGIFQIS